MRESKIYCDVCKKEIKSIYHHISTNCMDGYITAKAPNSLVADLCSKDCVIKWAEKNKEG